jgi:hypothetical protein
MVQPKDAVENHINSKLSSEFQSCSLGDDTIQEIVESSETEQEQRQDPVLATAKEESNQDLESRFSEISSRITDKKNQREM